jgi:hypothetical protein
MRTTLEIDDDVMAAVRAVARATGRPLGQVVSDLARRGLARRDVIDADDDFPTIAVAPDAPPITPELVAAALDEP